MSANDPKVKSPREIAIALLLDAPSTYLEEGVYTQWDGYHFWLQDRANSPLNQIAFDPGALHNLAGYLNNAVEFAGGKLPPSYLGDGVYVYQQAASFCFMANSHITPSSTLWVTREALAGLSQFVKEVTTKLQQIHQEAP